MKPTTEHIITALCDGIALRTDLCERLGCQNAALTKVIRNMLDRDLITRDLQDGALAYYLTSKGRAWRPGMQSASVRAKAKAKGGDSEGGEADVRVIEPAAVKSDEVSAANEAKADIPAPQYDPNSVAFSAESRDAWRLVAARYGCADPDSLDRMIVEMGGDLGNARALADKLQSLLTSKEHECESLRAQMAHACTGGCRPVLETVPLAELIQHIALFLDDGQSLTIYGSDTASVQAFGKSFVCSYSEANGVLDASAMLARLEAA